MGFGLKELRRLRDTLLELAAANNMDVHNAIQKFFTDIEEEYDKKLGYELKTENLKAEILKYKEALNNPNDILNQFLNSLAMSYSGRQSTDGTDKVDVSEKIHDRPSASSQEQAGINAADAAGYADDYPRSHKMDGPDIKNSKSAPGSLTMRTDKKQQATPERSDGVGGIPKTSQPKDKTNPFFGPSNDDDLKYAITDLENTPSSYPYRIQENHYHKKIRQNAGEDKEQDSVVTANSYFDNMQKTLHKMKKVLKE